MAPRGAILARRNSVTVMPTLHDHHPVGVAIPPAAMPSMIAMLAKFGARAIAMMIAALDHDGLGTCNRRRRDGDRAKSCENVSKLLHVILSQLSEEKTLHATERSEGT